LCAVPGNNRELIRRFMRWREERRKKGMAPGDPGIRRITGQQAGRTRHHPAGGSSRIPEEIRNLIFKMTSFWHSEAEKSVFDLAFSGTGTSSGENGTCCFWGRMFLVLNEIQELK
jgi:hypothetical protein